MRTQPLAVLAIAASATLALSACTTGSAGESSTSTIRTTMNAAPTSLAPWEAQNADDYLMDRLLYNTLVRRGETGEPVPALATDWEASPDEAEFTLRDDATCSDGTPITPSVVKASLENFHKAENSPFRNLVFGDGTVTVEADDDAGTVTIRLSEPWADLVSGLSLEAAGIVCPAGLEDPEGLRKGHVDGAYSGPYALSASSHGVSYTLDLQEDFAGWPEYGSGLEGEPASTVEVSVTPNQSARANEILTDGLDVTTINTQDMTRISEEKGYLAERVPYGAQYLLFNERPGSVFGDVEVRRAVAQAVNRSAFNSAATGGLGDLAETFSHEAVPCANPDESLLIETDPDAASNVLQGKPIRILGLDVVGPQGAGNTYISEALREGGAEVELRNVDLSTWSTDGATKPNSWDLTVFPALNAGGTLYGAMSPIVGPPTDKGGLNWSGNAHPELMAKVAKAMSTIDEDERCEIYADVQEQMITEADVVPLAYMPAQVTARPGFSVGVYGGRPDYSTMRITGEG